MKSSRIVPLSLVAALVVTLALIGLPWPSSPTLANFSGKIIYSAGENDLDLSGYVNLFDLQNPSAQVELRVTCAGEEKRIPVDPVTGRFSGTVGGEAQPGETIPTVLEVDGQDVAGSRIALPHNTLSCVHIIRFTSLS